MIRAPQAAPRPASAPLRFGTILIERNTAAQPESQFSLTYVDDNQTGVYYRQNSQLAERNLNGGATEKWSELYPITHPDPSGLLTREKRFENIEALLHDLRGKFESGAFSFPAFYRHDKEARNTLPKLVTDRITVKLDKLASLYAAFKDPQNEGEYTYTEITPKEGNPMGQVKIPL